MNAHATPFQPMTWLPDEQAHYTTLSPSEQMCVHQSISALQDPALGCSTRTPRIAALAAGLPHALLQHVLQRIASASPAEAAKVGRWALLVSDVCRTRVTASPTLREVRQTLRRVRTRMDKCIVGQDLAKRALLHTCSRAVQCSGAPARAICLSGAPGVGKTSLARAAFGDGLGLPFAVVPMGGSSGASLLQGHAFTYESAQPGAIAELLARAPDGRAVLLCDEIDKLSESPQGAEIESCLLHLLDPTQNDQFMDRYLGPLAHVDASRIIFVFTMNNPQKVNPVLLDRMTVTHVEGYTVAMRQHMLKSAIVPRYLREARLSTSLITDEAIAALSSAGGSERCGARAAERAVQHLVDAALLSKATRARGSAPARLGALQARQAMALAEQSAPATLSDSAQHMYA